MQRFAIDHLFTLIALVEEGTFERAAFRLSITPSAVSQRIKTMEEAAGRVLVRRSAPVTTTEAGASVLRYARQVALLESDTTRDLGGDLDGVGPTSTTVPLAVNADSLATWFLPSIADLAQADSIAFDLHREDQERTTTLLRSGAVLAAVTSTAEPVQGCLTSALGVMRYRAVCAPDFSARWRPEHPDLAFLLTAPMVVFDRHDDLQDSFVRNLALPGGSSGPTGPRHTVPASEDFARAVGLGFGWGVLPELQCLERIADGGLVDLAPQRPVDVALYWQRWNLRSALLDAVTDAVSAGAARSLRRA